MCTVDDTLHVRDKGIIEHMRRIGAYLCYRIGSFMTDMHQTVDELAHRINGLHRRIEGTKESGIVSYPLADI
jgi:hypothetical protein